MNKEGATAEQINAATEEIKSIKAKVEALKEIEAEDDFEDGIQLDEKDDAKATKESSFINAVKSVGGYAKVTSKLPACDTSSLSAVILASNASTS